MRSHLIILGCLVGLLALQLPAGAAVPHLINYQGYLTDRHGNPIEGTHNLTFKVYTGDGSGATLLWTEVHTGLSITEGIFHIILGSLTPIGDDLFAESPRWMGITVDSDAEIAPRMELTSVPWALNAAVADSARHVAGGMADGHSLDADDGSPTDAVYVNGDGNVGIGTNDPWTRLHLSAPQGQRLMMLTGGGVNLFGVTVEPTLGDRMIRFENTSDIPTGGFEFFPTAPAFSAPVVRIQNNGQVAISGALDIRDNSGLAIRSPSWPEYGMLTISPYQPGRLYAEIRSGAIEDIVISPSGGDGRGRVRIQDVMRLEPRATFPDNPQEGDLCVRRYEVPGPQGLGWFPVCNVYCYLLGQWKQLDN